MSRKRLLFLGLLGVSAVISLVAFVVVPRSSARLSPEQVLRRYTTAVYARDYAQAYQFIAEADKAYKSREEYLRENGPFEGFTLKLTRFPFTMVEVAYLSRRFRIPLEEVLRRLREAGLDSMPGGGAEIFSERVRRIICDHKIDGDEWLEVARLAHRMGIKSNCTMLYGHIETEEDRVDHLLRLRALQDETGGFVTYIPLAFHPDNTPLEHLPKTTGFADLKNIAVARLLLDNIPHIKAYWIMMTPKIAQIAQRFGADAIDGTVVEARI